MVSVGDGDARKRISIDSWLTVAFVVMRESAGGIKLSDIDDMTFPELVQFWSEAILFR